MESPYEEYVDEWNVIPEDLVEAEAQGGDVVVDQGISENPFYSNEEFADSEYVTDMEDCAGATTYEKEVEPIEPISAETPRLEGSDRPTRTHKSCSETGYEFQR